MPRQKKWKSRRFLLSSEMVDFLARNVKGTRFADLTARFNARFGTNASIKRIIYACDSRGLTNGLHGKYTNEMIDFLARNVKGTRFADLTARFNACFGTTASVKRIKDACKLRKFTNGITGRRRGYTDEMIDFLARNIKGTRFPALTARFNARFGTAASVGQIKEECVRRGFNRKYSKEMIDFLARNAEGTGFAALADLTELFNAHFGLKATIGQVKTLCAKAGLFRKHCPSIRAFAWEHYLNQSPVLLKTESGSCLKQRFLWEQKHGPLPEGYRVIFADGNRQNFSTDNLIAVSASEVAYMRHFKMFYEHAELTKAGAIVARLLAACKNVQQKTKVKNDRQ